MTRHASAAVRAESYVSPARTLVIIDPSPRHRDEVARLASSAFRVSDFPDVESAIARVMKSPSAIVVGAGLTAADQRQPISRLRKHLPFGRTPVIHFGQRPKANPQARDQDPDAEVSPKVTAMDLIRLIGGLADKTVEEDWGKLPEGPRTALRETLSLFKGAADLMGKNQPIEFKTVAAACSPVIYSIRSGGLAHIFEGLRNHNDIWYVHSLRVATLLALFGYKLGLDETSLMTLTTAGLVHDFGKTAYPPHLTHKMEKLSPEDLITAQGHVGATSEYLRQKSDVPKAVIMVAEQHHERLDGSGYPARLKGDAINDLSRMAAIVDVFAALTEHRPYRAAMSPFQAIEVMEELMRDKLDLKLVRLFRGMLLEAA